MSPMAAWRCLDTVQQQNSSEHQCAHDGHEQRVFENSKPSDPVGNTETEGGREEVKDERQRQDQTERTG